MIIEILIISKEMIWLELLHDLLKNIELLNYMNTEKTSYWMILMITEVHGYIKTEKCLCLYAH
jgi:hypothetical protein